MKHSWMMSAVLAVAACGPKSPPEPSAGLARCETGLSHRVCKCAFDAMPTERWLAFAGWAEKHKGVSDAAVWNDISLHAALAATTDNAAETEAAARELVFLKATCGVTVTQHAISALSEFLPPVDRLRSTRPVRGSIVRRELRWEAKCP